MAKVPIGLQLYSVRSECEKDLPGCLKATAEAGYAGAEPWGYDGAKEEWMGFAAADLRKLYDDNGLKCCGMHLMTGALLGDNLARTISLNRTLGNRFLIVAADKPRMSSVEGIKELAGILNDVSEKLKPLGMETGYHAHPFDFEIIEGEIAWYRLFSATGPEVVMQMDIGNCVGGGGDPIAALRKFPGRARTVHLKDYGGGPDSVIGEGKADWPLIFDLCEKDHATEWYVVEEGSASGFGFEIPRRSLEALRRMGK
ncbi:MAG: sugar phosphate isomerase/epimerase [Armatimonadetes bacterium]|nr:sugar phosphate isomerase/epimerase [Armatimonadota bacterium]